MTILVTGATGTVGTQVLKSLEGSGAEIRALTRSPEKARLPPHVTAVKGDLADIDQTRAALKDVSTLFLLALGGPDELTQAMQTLNAARNAGVKGVVYLSVYKAEEYTDVPHFAAKAAIERMIAANDLPATVLRPAYFIQNDLGQKTALMEHGVYAMPNGSLGISLVDVRDIGEAAAKELLRRERAAEPLPRETYALVGPDALEAEDFTSIWTEVLGRAIAYAGDDLDAFEQTLRAFSPAWQAYDLKLMMRAYQQQGAAATPEELERLTALLGHAPRSYRAFAEETAAEWRK